MNPAERIAMLKELYERHHPRTAYSVTKTKSKYCERVNQSGLDKEILVTLQTRGILRATKF